MAEIIVTDTSVNLNVTTTQSNVTVTDLETNVTVNVASLSSNITVTNEAVNVTIAPSIGVSNSEVRAALGNVNPILYDPDSGVFSFDADAAFNNAKVIGAIQSGNITLKQVQETYFDAGDVTSTTMNLDLVNGTIQKVTLKSNVNQINVANLSPGGSFTVFVEQDAFGFRLLDTSTNFNDWLFVDDYKTLSVGAGNIDSLSVIFDGSTSYASLVKLNSADIDATFDNVTVRYNTIANVLTANAVTINTSLGLTGPLTSTSTANFSAAVTLGNNLNVGGQLFADGNQIYIGQLSTGSNKIITAYSSSRAGQIYYGGADGIWYFTNNTGGGPTYKLPTSTTDVAEGINLYFSTSRANSAIQDYKGTITTQGNITTTANVQGNYLLGNGAFITGVVGLSNSQVLSYIATQPLTVGGNLTVNGNINATGNINVQNVEDLYVRDQTIVMNANAVSAANVQIVANRPTLANTELKWNEQSDRWTFTNDGTTYYNLATSTTDVAEGANLYYTTDRANTAIAAYRGDINVGSAEINGNLVLDPTAGNANIVGQSTQDDLTVAFENIELKIGSFYDEGRFYVKEHEGNALLSLSGAESDNNTLRILGDVIIGVDPNTSNATGQFVFDVAQGDLDIAGGLEAVSIFAASSISSLDGDIFTVAGNISTTNGYLNGNARFATGIITTNVTEGTNLYYTSDRANTAIDTRVNKAFVEGLGVSYTSLSDKPIIPTHTSNLTNDSGFITAATANVISVNGKTGVVALDTGDIAENGNLYFTSARANTAIADKLIDSSQKKAFNVAVQDLYLTPDAANATGGYYMPNGPGSVGDVLQLTGSNQSNWQRLDTGDVDEGANLYYTTARANSAIDDYVVGSENITVTSGAIALTNALGNVNSVTSEASTNFTINTDSKLVLTEQIKGVTTYTGNINGDGYGFFLGAGLTGQLLVNNVDAGNLDSYFFTTGNATAGSNVITGASIALIIAGAANVSANLDVITPYYTVSPFGSPVQDPFPQGTYVTSVDAANSTITLNNPAAVSRDLSVSFTGGGTTFQRTALIPGAYDSATGFLAGLITNATAGVPGLSRTTIVGQSIFTQGAYGYPETGPAPADFVYSIGNSSNYSQGNLPTNRFAARTTFEAPRTVFSAPRGLVIGNADLTGRAENDSGSTFGINVLWDGLTTSADYGGGQPATQILLKQYSDNSFATGGFETRGGPRILFTAARGNKNQSYLATYPRTNDEMGRLVWWGPTQYLPTTSTVNPPAWISGVAGQDFVDTNSGMGMYFANSPNTSTFDRSLYLASSKGATLIASAQDSTSAQQPIIFAPSHLIPTGTNNGNSVFLYNQTVSGTELAIDSYSPSGAHFAQINYANITGLTGAKVSVTNGNNFATVHEGNIALSIDRNSNSANVKVAARTGAANYYGGNNPDRVRFNFTPEGLADGTAVTISGFTNATVAGALNGNVFYVKSVVASGVQYYELYYNSGLTSGVNLAVGNINAGPGVFEYTRTNSVTAKEWSLVLPQGSNNLVLTEDGAVTTTFASGGNINLATNATINYDAVYGCFHNMANVTAAAADTVYEFAWPNVHIDTNRVTVASNSRITVGQEGTYNFALEMQAENADNQDRTAYLWLAKNGTDIDETCVRVSLLKEWKQVIVKEWIVQNLAANDYIEVRFAVDNTSGIQLTSIPAQASPYARPAVPSAVITITPVGV